MTWEKIKKLFTSANQILVTLWVKLTTKWFTSEQWIGFKDRYSLWVALAVFGLIVWVTANWNTSNVAKTPPPTQIPAAESLTEKEALFDHTQVTPLSDKDTSLKRPDAVTVRKPTNAPLVSVEKATKKPEVSAKKPEVSASVAPKTTKYNVDDTVLDEDYKEALDLYNTLSGKQ